MASITTFARLEPQPRRGDVTVGAAAPVHDPMWLLARQWQVGEFAGHDGGSPIVARWRGVAAAPTRFVAGPIPPEHRARRAPVRPARPRRWSRSSSASPRRCRSTPTRPPGSASRSTPAGTSCALLGQQVTSRDYRADFLARYVLAMPSRRAARRARPGDRRLRPPARRPQPGRPTAAGRARRPRRATARPRHRTRRRRRGAPGGGRVDAPGWRRSSTTPTPTRCAGSRPGSSTRPRWPAGGRRTRSARPRSPRPATTATPSTGTSSTSTAR